MSEWKRKRASEGTDERSNVEEGKQRTQELLGALSVQVLCQTSQKPAVSEAEAVPAGIEFLA